MTATGLVLAYIDPGSGSFALQALVGAIAAGIVFLKLTWERFVGRRRGRQTDQAPRDPQAPVQ